MKIKSAVLLVIFLALGGSAFARDYELYPPRIPAPKIAEVESPAGQTHTFPALDTNNAFTGNNTHSGTETFLNLNDILWVGAGAGSYNTVAAAVTAAGAVNKTIIGIRSTFAGTCPAATLSTTNPNIIIWDFSGLCLPGTPTTSYNGTSYNMFDGNVLALQRSNFGPSTISAAGAIVNGYFITATNNLVVGTGNTVDGVSAECDLFGTQTGTLPNCTAAEHNVSVQSGGGTVTNAYAGVFASGTFNSSANCFGSANCTAVTNMGGGHFFGCRAPLGAIPVNCYGGYFNDQLGRASARNYSAAFEGKVLFMWSGNSGAGGADCEDIAHVTHPCVFVDPTGALNLQSPTPSSGANGGIYINKSTGGTSARISDSQFLFFSTPVPNAAGNFDLGTTAIPWGNLFLGTAATNNFKFQPAATAAARVISMPDPLGAVNMPYVIASGTTTLTANAALAAVTSQAANTTAATGTLTTDSIEWSFATAPTAGDNLCHVLTYVTAGNVNFVRTNPTAAAQNVSALVINWRVIR